MPDMRACSVRSLLTWFSAAMVLGALGACALPGSEVPKRDVAVIIATALVQPDVPALPAQWWQALGDAQLNALLNQALAGHPTLGMAQARVAQAQAALDQVQAAQGPQASLEAGFSLQRYSAHGLVPPPLAGSVRSVVQGQASVAWELADFGRHHQALAAATGHVRAAQAEAAVARHALATQVVRSWVALAGVAAQGQALQAQAALQQQAARLLERRVAAGLEPMAALREAQAVLPELQRLAERLNEDSTRLRHALAALSQATPTQAAGWAPHLQSLRTPTWPEQLPAELLARRADLAAHRQRVQAALGEVGLAQAQFFPNINLVAFAGLSGLGLERALRAGSLQVSAGPVLHLPWFDADRLRAHLGERVGAFDVAVQAYHQAVLQAVREAADAAAGLQAVRAQQRERNQAMALGAQQRQLAQARFDAGLTHALPLLQAQAAEQHQQLDALALQTRLLDAHIALAQALGGGYQGPHSP